jgi:two-component system NtrC family sensor kinase
MTTDLREAQDELTAWSSKLEAKLQEKTDELSQSQRQVAHMDKMASLGKLAATVAHELNNPLAGILTYAKLVERTFKESGGALDEQSELDRYLHLIQKEASRSGTIVRNLLTFARRSGSEFALHPLKPIMERSMMLIRHHIEMSGIQLESELPADDLTLLCDGDQIQQALLALLINAVEAMPNGGALRLMAESTDDFVVIYVEDTGVGIPEEALTRIFEPFFSTKNDAHGAGLGLAVVYGIVQWHGGKIEVDSQLNRGTRFRIALPRQPAAGRETADGRVPEEMNLHAER